MPAFNIYFCLLSLAVFGLALSGCKTGDEGKKSKQATLLRLHLEEQPDQSDRAEAITVFRAAPVKLAVSKAPFLHEASIVSATLVEAIGGFAIRVDYDRSGTWLLENVTATNKGKRIGIFTLFTEPRWLAAPMISQTIRDGVIIFTPDATREEAERIVLGINNMVKKLKR